MKLCKAWQWLISWRRDTGKPLPSPVNAHLRKCPQCRKFVKDSESLEARLGSAASKMHTHGNDKLARKIISALPPERTHTPLHRRTFKFALIVGSSLAAAGIAFLLLNPSSKSPDSIDGSILRIELASNMEKIFNASKGMESPVDEEMRKFSSAIQSAASSLASSLQPNLAELPAEAAPQGKSL